MKNRQICLCSRPNGIPQATDFALREADLPTISDGEFLVRNQFLSADPAMRGWIADKSTYWPRIEAGDTMRAFAVGDVIESRNPAYAVGDKAVQPTDAATDSKTVGNQPRRGPRFCGQGPTVAAEFVPAASKLNDCSTS